MGRVPKDGPCQYLQFRSNTQDRHQGGSHSASLLAQMTHTLRVVQAFDRALVAEVAADDGGALEKKLVAAAEAMRNRDGWLRPHQRSAVLQRAASLLEARQEPFVTLIAREGGKPASDAAAEVIRAIDGLRNAAEALRTFAGREIPMGLTPASERRWAFTTKEPIGVVAAISAFNHPLNLIVHQVAPAIAVGCPSSSSRRQRRRCRAWSSSSCFGRQASTKRGVRPSSPMTTPSRSVSQPTRE